MTNSDNTRNRPSPMLAATRLWQRTSAKGTPYLAGRLGALRVLVMPKPANEPGDHTHNLLLAEAPQREGGER